MLVTHASRIVAVAVIVLVYLITRIPDPSAAEVLCARHFKFDCRRLPELPGRRTIRAVNPSLKNIAGWISSVGASAAFGDLDGDGVANDVVYVDTRNDQVMVAPIDFNRAPRYPFFALHPPPHFNPKTMAPMGCVAADLNEDGLMDVLVYYWGRTPVAYLRKADCPTLSADAFKPVELVPGNEEWYTNCATLADVDGDGHVDIVIGNYFQAGSRVLDEDAETSVQMQRSMSNALNGGRKKLLLWSSARGGPDPDVTYRQCNDAFSEEVSRGWTLAVGCADLDGDLLPEIYFANDFGPDRLLHNESTPGHPRFRLLEGRPGFCVPKSKVLGHDSFKGMGVDFGDVRGDGTLAIYVSNIASKFALLESHFLFERTCQSDEVKSLMNSGIAPYEDMSEPLGLSRSEWSWDAKLADFDNDGVLQAVQATGFVNGTTNRWPELQELATGSDLLLQNPANWPRFSAGDALSESPRHPFFVWTGRRYVDFGEEVGFPRPSDHVISRGIAIADVDNDGLLDIVMANQWGPSYIYHNVSPNPGNFIGLRLRLPIEKDKADFGGVREVTGKTPRSLAAIGATATIRLSSGRRLTAQVDGGNGHSGRRSPELHFGIGKDTSAQLELSWRDRQGGIHKNELTVAAGWHTLLLGSKE